MLRKAGMLPVLLSVIAGMSDVIGFITFGVFTAHVTGNVVLLAALLVRGGVRPISHLLTIPVFLIAVAVVWLAARRHGAGARRSSRRCCGFTCCCSRSCWRTASAAMPPRIEMASTA